MAALGIRARTLSSAIINVSVTVQQITTVGVIVLGVYLIAEKELTVGALRPKGAQQLLSDAELPGVGNVLERVADAVEVRSDGEGEALYIRLGFGSVTGRVLPAPND